MITVVYEATGHQVQLRDDTHLELYLTNGWKEVKDDGPSKPRRSGTVPAKAADKRGKSKG